MLVRRLVSLSEVPMFESRNRAGFTLIELMIVVTLIAVISALALPALQSSRRRGNEANAVGALRTMSNVQEMSRSRTGSYSTIPELIALGYIDDTFGQATRNGYGYQMPGAPSNFAYQIQADPSAPGDTGDRFFYIDNSNVIRFSTGGTANSTSPPLD